MTAAGTVYDIAPAADGKLAALVMLDGEDTPREVTFWPELREQYGADKLRRFLVRAAAVERDAELAAAAVDAAQLEQARDALGAGTVDGAEFEPQEATTANG